MKTLLIIVSSLILLLVNVEVKAENFCGINIKPILSSVGSCDCNGTVSVMLWEHEGVSDSLDTYDTATNLANCFCMDGQYYEGESPALRTLWDGPKSIDYRPWSSTLVFEMGLFYSFADIAVDSENKLEVSWNYSHTPEPTEPFGDRTAILKSDKFLYGYAVDIKRLLHDAGLISKEIPLGIIESNFQGLPSAFFNLYIGTKILADLNDDGKVNIEDYAILARDWGKTQGKYYGDISGLNGIPDGYVNFYDLADFVSVWLEQ
jgi:hypothetical protein